MKTFSLLAIILFIVFELVSLALNAKRRINTDLPASSLLQDIHISYPKQIHRSDHFLFSHFYQHINQEDQNNSWQVSSITSFMNFDYIQLSLILKQGDYLETEDQLWSTGITHQYGFSLSQSYTTNDSIYILFMHASGNYFPRSTFNGKYSWKAGATTTLSIDAWGLCYGRDEFYFSLAPTFSKQLSNHLLTIKPYWTVSLKGRINLFLSDRIEVGRHSNYLYWECESGYYPNKDTMIEYKHIADTRCTLVGKGSFQIGKERLSLQPLIGAEYTKNQQEKIDWYLQLGLQYEL